MMLHVVAFDVLEITAAHWKVVRGVMGEVVNEVTDNETGEKRSNPLTRVQENCKYEVEKSIKNCSERNGNNRGHDQARLHLRLCVMDAMEEEYDAFRAGTLDGHVKKETMERVFGKGPQEQAKQKTKRDIRCERARWNLDNGADEEKERDGEPDDDHGDWTDVGEKFEEIRFEQSDGNVTMIGW